MGKCDVAVCNYLSDNDRFAELVNASEFGGKQVLRGDMLETDDGRYANLRPKQKQNEAKLQAEQRFRDIKKRTKNGEWLVITAIENQENIDFTMPLRIMEYDCLEYNSQVRKIKSDKAKKLRDKGKKPCKWNTALDKEDRLYPVHTICFYHGTERWNGPRSLKDMMDFDNAPPEWEALFHDYGMSLFCAGEVEDLSGFKTGLKQFLEVLPLRNNKDKLDELWSMEAYRHLDRDTAEIIAIITDNDRVLERLDEYELKGEYNMCKAMDELKEDWMTKGIECGIEQGIEQAILDAIRNLMQTMQFTVEQAMDALLVPKEDRKRYLAKL